MFGYDNYDIALIRIERRYLYKQWLLADFTTPIGVDSHPGYAYLLLSFGGLYGLFMSNESTAHTMSGEAQRYKSSLEKSVISTILKREYYFHAYSAASQILCNGSS